MNNTTGSTPRRRIAEMNLLGVTQLHARNPYVTAAWSVMFPGFGHLLLSKYLQAYVLFIWEIVLNTNAHVNMALFYTALGRFDAATAVVDLRWSLLYIPTYIYAVWDSYRSAVELNKQFILASREEAPLVPFVIRPFGIGYLDKRPALVAGAWCALTPGLGHIMIQRLAHGLFAFCWWITVVYMSNLLTAVNLTFLGHFNGARASLDPQWYMNIPSLLFFCVYVTYVNSVESNKLFDREQSQFLKRLYQSEAFPFPYIKDEGVGMYIVSTFAQSLHVELAVTAAEEAGVPKKNILAVPVRRQLLGGRFFDTLRTATGDSVFDLAMILAAVASLLGSIYGFVLHWGPVVWGVIGGFIGFSIGFLIKMLFLKKKQTGGYENEVVIVVSCQESMGEAIRKILQDNGALGVSLVRSPAT